MHAFNGTRISCSMTYNNLQYPLCRYHSLKLGLTRRIGACIQRHTFLCIYIYHAASHRSVDAYDNLKYPFRIQRHTRTYHHAAATGRSSHDDAYIQKRTMSIPGALSPITPHSRPAWRASMPGSAPSSMSRSESFATCGFRLVWFGLVLRRVSVRRMCQNADTSPPKKQIPSVSQSSDCCCYSSQLRNLL